MELVPAVHLLEPPDACRRFSVQRLTDQLLGPLVLLDADTPRLADVVDGSVVIEHLNRLRLH